MTLIAAVKVGDSGCVIGDFRLTKVDSGDQFDIAQKFVFINNRLILFMAGAVFTLGPLKTIIEERIDRITHQNIDDENGILYQIVKEYFDALPLEMESVIIGLHLDVSNGTNKIFRIDALSNDGKRLFGLVPDSSFESEVIGSGCIITDQSKFQHELMPLSKIFKNTIDKGYNVRTATDAVEQEILNRLKKFGPSIYQELGITSVLNVSFFIGSAFRVEGRTVEGFHVEKNQPLKTWSYTYGKDSNGIVFLTDNSTSKKTTVHMPDNDFPFNRLDVEEIFDPTRIERRSKKE
jgi:hypothetical protein